MNWFYNRKLRTKLITCFILLAIFTAVVGTIGVLNMNTINKKSQEMYYNNSKPIESLSKIQTALQTVRAYHLMALYDQNPDTIQEQLDAIDSLVQQTNKLLTEYENTELVEKEKELLQELKTSLTDYRTKRNDNLDLIKNQQYNQAQATLKDVSTAREKMDKILQSLIDYNSQLALDTITNNNNSFKVLLNTMIGIIVATVIIALLLGVFIASIISKPVNEIAMAAEKMAQGDLNVNVTGKYKDEIGQLAKSFEIMVTNMNEVLANVSEASEQVNSGASQVSDSSMTLSQGATEQASSIEELTASVEEISSQTRLNAENATKASVLANKAKENAVVGNDQMKDMLTSIEDINNASSNISKIIKVIDDIAFQTNILALNAAVEAARAGQHGKGFAVVAEEVRNLAARSANAAKETTDMIEGTIKKTENGTRIAKETASALDMIVGGIEQVAELVNNIAIASNEQAIGIEQVNQGIIQVSTVVQNNTATSEESAAASEELSSQAGLLKEMVSRFKLRHSTYNYQHHSMGSQNMVRQDAISSEVFAMLNHNRDNDSMSHSVGMNEGGSKKPRIILNDNEFGKY